jgi:hypothetical protein
MENGIWGSEWTDPGRSWDMEGGWMERDGGVEDEHKNEHELGHSDAEKSLGSSLANDTTSIIVSIKFQAFSSGLHGARRGSSIIEVVCRYPIIDTSFRCRSCF